MTGTTNSSRPTSLNRTCDDEEHFSCQICCMNFDEIERVPKYLVTCHHFFCLPCIKNLIGLVERNEVVCPFCLVSSTISKGRCEELVTNHVALCLLKVVESLAKSNKEKIEQQWCSECKSYASVACQQNKHQFKIYADALNEQSLQLNSQIKEQQLTCNKILEDCHKIQSVNQLVLSCTSWLQSEFSHRNVSNNTVMAQIESIKLSKDSFIQENMVKTLKIIEELKIKFSSGNEDVKAAGSTVFNVLNSISCAQQESEYLASSDAFDFDSWLKKANIFHWETGNNQSSLKVCVRVLAFVFKLLSGELDNTGSASVVDSSNSGKRRCNGDAIEEERKENNEPLASVSGTQQIPKRMSQDHPDDAPLGKKFRLSSPTNLTHEPAASQAQAHAQPAAASEIETPSTSTSPKIVSDGILAEQLRKDKREELIAIRGFRAEKEKESDRARETASERRDIFFRLCDSDYDSEFDSAWDPDLNSDLDSKFDSDLDSDFDSDFDSDLDSDFDSDLDSNPNTDLDSDVDYNLDSDLDSDSD